MKEEPDFIKTAETIFQCQVCSTKSWDEALDWLQRNSPAGTTGNWQKDEREEVKPVPCGDIPGRTHYVFNC